MVKTIKLGMATGAFVLALFMLLPCVCAPAEPQSEADSVLQAAPMVQLGLSTSTVNFGAGTLQPRHTPYTQSITATVNSNAPWRLSVSKDHDLLGTIDSIPSAGLTFSAAGPPGKTTYAAPAGTEFGGNTRVVEGIRGSNLMTAITYSLAVPWEIEPDTYSATHIYTASLI